MIKRTGTTAMTTVEKVAGSSFLALYLLVFPRYADDFFNLVESMCSTTLSQSASSALYYYGLLVVTCLIFYRYLGGTTTVFANAVWRSLQAMFLGLVGFYGVSETLFQLGDVLHLSYTNFADATVFASVDAVPPMGALSIVVVVPFIEEVLFRGLVFGNLQSKQELLGYGVSMTLYALSYVVTLVLSGAVFESGGNVWLLCQSLVAGFSLAWVYQRSGTLWASIGLHALINALVLW